MFLIQVLVMDYNGKGNREVIAQADIDINSVVKAVELDPKLPPKEHWL